jgi:hypothetical protein
MTDWCNARLVVVERARGLQAYGGCGRGSAGGDDEVWSKVAALSPADVPRIADAALDPLVLAFGLCLSIATVLLFGVGPAFLAARRDPNDALLQLGRGSTRSASQSRLRRLLLALEGALSALLLVGAGTLMHSFANLAGVEIQASGPNGSSLSAPRCKRG